MLFITAGMGGGTGTGASPVIAKLAKEMGLLTVAIVTSPLAVEGKIRYEQAFRGIEELRQNTDSLLIINNENILEIYGRLSLKQAFGKADDILASAAKGIAEIITTAAARIWPWLRPTATSAPRRWPKRRCAPRCWITT